MRPCGTGLRHGLLSFGIGLLAIRTDGEPRAAADEVPGPPKVLNRGGPSKRSLARREP
jgi:hypothetical protein